MSNILKTIDLTDHAIRRAVFAVLDGFAAEHRGKCKGSDRLSTGGLARVLGWQFGLRHGKREPLRHGAPTITCATYALGVAPVTSSRGRVEL
jgi:hypothetical protein